MDSDPPMKVFVLSFGTIELLDGILVIDTDLSYKTFEKEYIEVLSQAGKDIKKILKNTFENGEYEIKDSIKEDLLLEVLEKLEAYDNPSFNFSETFEPSKGETSSDEPIQTEDLEPPEQEEPDIFEEPEILENYESEMLEEPLQSTLEDQAESKSENERGAVDLQDVLPTINLEDTLGKPEIPEFPVEEEPMLPTEIDTEGVASKFLVQLTENADFKLDHDQKIQDATVTGKILLKNSGKNDRIWDINLNLDKSKIRTTSLKQNHFHINELSPGKTWEQDYTVRNPKKVPILFKESIDTFLENSEEIHTLIPKQETVLEFNFFLENQENHEITNLKLEKEFPEAFTSLKLIDEIPSKTELEFEDQILTWKVLSLEPEQAINLKIQGKISPPSIDNIKTGPIRISFTNSNDLYSTLMFEDVSSISKNMYYIEKDEKVQFPNNWNCRFIFENKSEFPILLENAEIFSGDISSDKKEIVFRTINEIIYPADDEWRSQEWTVIDEDVPTFGKNMKFKIVPSTTKSLIVNISIDEVELPLLWAEVRKTYSVPEIASYVDTSVEVKTSIINQGDAEINELTIKDFIPENFIPPSLDDIKFLLNGKVLDKSKQKIELYFNREPDTDDSSEPHQLHIQLVNLQDSIGAIKKKSKLELQYALKAIKPPPDKVYTFPITVTANTQSEGPSLEITPDMVENSEIKVTHRRRKLTVGKSVFPGDATGEYEILMVFKNRGNTPIENAVISDLVPTNFKLLTSEPKASISEIETKTLLEWKFDVIEPGKKLEITYKIKGTGEYKTSDAEIFHKG
ncbi:MAG: hypothetical protein HWN66_09665 [Candidatus Helarchaeota archaeon]|nr:hypothetical protein [Candidatus Helarchaeota archaeon]